MEYSMSADKSDNMKKSEENGDVEIRSASTKGSESWRCIRYIPLSRTEKGCKWGGVTWDTFGAKPFFFIFTVYGLWFERVYL